MCGSVAWLLLDQVASFFPISVTSIMPATTEICTLALVDGSDIGDPNGAAATVMKECYDTIASQEGLQKLWFGREHESPGTLQLFLGECSAPVLCSCRSPRT